jgi:hypothetical protein
MSDERITELVQTYGPLCEEFFQVDGMELYLDVLPLLARGRPVSLGRLGEAVGRPRDEVAEAVRSLPDVSDATVEGRDPPTVVVTVDGSKTAVLSALEDRGIEIRDFETTEASLEEVFQSYTTDAGTEVQAR